MNRYRWRKLESCGCCDRGPVYLAFRERRYQLKADVDEQVNEWEPECDRAMTRLLEAEFDATKPENQV
jgi:hypothetical protein